VTSIRTAFLLAMACVLVTAEADEPLSLDGETARISYSLGFQIGGDFKRQQVDMDAAAVVQGIEDAVSGAEPKIPPAEMREALIALKQQVVAAEKQRSVERELEQLAEGKRFMEENAGKDGVITTESGLQYRVIAAGTGKSPGPQEQVTVNYRGRLLDGREFDSSFKRGQPATFKLNGVIKGWSEGLQLMKEGGKAELYIPPNLAYGDRGPLAHQTLTFEVELLSVGETQAAGSEAAATNAAAAGAAKASE
jgi:FKBP-type peptidyl-prolyl cis-trans isomerase FklB